MISFPFLFYHSYAAKAATTHTVGYTIEDCELYHLQYAGKSGKGRRNLRRDLSSKGSKSGGEGIDVVSISFYIMF